MLTLSSVIIFAGLMVWAAISDIRHYRLSNRLCLTVLALYPIHLAAFFIDYNTFPLALAGWSIVIALVIFGVCLVFFAMNVMGGGDVKLIPVVALWAGPALVLNYLMIMSLTGGLLAALILAKNKFIASKAAKSSENINFSMAQMEHTKVPYGVGIALGGLYVAIRLYMSLNGRA
ncbi:A24 family peptidase [Emcibacter nanhaiensis]|uniref:A24 family peptidase n=1 Tax=Emcibacter nanhaiensis TaxID=1505037 RepID=UPI0015E414D1|nr:prepilin peptidase [Emcibacter nanhaiensis]